MWRLLRIGSAPFREAIAGAEGTTPGDLDAYDGVRDEIARLMQKAPR